jgi:holo-[acyl-carrier protein] synthase
MAVPVVRIGVGESEYRSSPLRLMRERSMPSGREMPLMSVGTAIRVGADVVAVHQVADSVACFGDRYLRRVYTEHEIASCVGSPSAAAAGLAARFAAKEATIKVLRPTDHQPDWRSIEVRKNPGGWCSMSLSGHAAVLADEAGIGELEVSLTHDDDDGGVAAAVIVALCQSSTALADEVWTHLRDFF